MKPDPNSKLTEALLELFKDPQPVQLEMSKQQCWALLCTVQLACRHPHFTGPTRKIVEDLTRAIGQHLCANNRDLQMLFEMGWNKQFDEEREKE